jgi:predicted short-subunit dehydrogenase-like oxidoreductase (DUF2520 family)
MARTISIVGAGRVGTTLGKRLREHGWRIDAVVTRSPQTARAAVKAIGAGTAYGSVNDLVATARRRSQRDGRAGLQPRRKLRNSPGALAPEASAFSSVFKTDVILLATPDDAFAGVVRTLAEIGGKNWRGKIVLHTSGTLDRAVLAPLARHGAATGSLHPMQTFSGKVTPNLAGVIFAIEGVPKARRIAQEIAKTLGGIPIAIESRDKPVYHAAAVLAAGSGFPLIESAVQMLISIGFTRTSAVQMLLPLIRQMLDNIERIGPRSAWTGPLSRGDYAIVAKHARALRKYPSELQQSYAALALLAGRMLAKNPAATLNRIKRALKGS